MGPFYVFESCRETALGDVQRGGTFALKDDALRYAARLHKENGTRVYVLSNAGANIYDTKRVADALPDEPRAVQTQVCPVCRTVHDLPLCPRPTP
jgi:hypothetical protein